MLESFTLADFTPRLGERFRLGGDVDGRVVLDTELGEATQVGEVGSAGGRAPFSLVFRGPHHVVLQQRIYRVDHAELGTFDLFLVPIGPDRAGMRYQAIFT